MFDRTGRIFVNIGAPSDACATAKNETRPCAAGEGASPLAAVWMFTPPAGGIFPALRPGEASPKHEVYARGLRNSMALAVHPRFPDAGFPLLQGENARDIPDAAKPNEEINASGAGQALRLAVLPRPRDASAPNTRRSSRRARPIATSAPTRRSIGGRIP